MSFSQDWDNFLSGSPHLPRDLFVPPVLPPYSVDGEEFWEEVAGHYSTGGQWINLNNGAVSSAPTHVSVCFTKAYALLNTAPAFYNWKVMYDARDIIKTGIAEVINSSPDEIALLRNTTEALNNVIFGCELKKGDEVIVCRQDYSKTISSWQQRALREGIVLKWIHLESSDDCDTVLTKYKNAITEKTRVAQVTHVLNWNGQVLPVREITGVMHYFGITVLLDAAHSFGLLEVDVKELGCDYMAAAMHKWLGSPISAGFLYVRKQRISDLWPLASAAEPGSGAITKFEELSVQSGPSLMAMGAALSYFNLIGRHSKETRLRFLKQYWVTRLAAAPHIRWYTPVGGSVSCTMVTLGVRGMKAPELEQRLHTEAGIHVGLIEWEQYQGIRIAPNIYTGLGELDRLVEVLNRLKYLS